jgi:hypothetical protein
MKTLRVRHMVIGVFKRDAIKNRASFQDIRRIRFMHEVQKPTQMLWNGKRFPHCGDGRGGFPAGTC